MGKKGDLLRQMKAAKQSQQMVPVGRDMGGKAIMVPKYVLDQHDHEVREQYRMKCEVEVKAQWDQKREEVNQMIDEEWKKRDNNENILHLLALLSNIWLEVLVEDFGFPRYVGRRNKTQRAAESFMTRMNDIAKDENKDIRTHAEEVYENVGFSFIREMLDT